MQRAVVCHKCGPYNKVLSLTTSPIPETPEGMVKVRVHSAGIAFPDVLVVEGKHIFQRTAPFIPGTELSGEVVEIGKDVVGVKVGDYVFGTTATGSLAEYAFMYAADCHSVPDGVSLEVCAGFEINYGTAWHGLKDLAKIKPGETVLILGASGGVGMAAIDISKALGATVVACASTDHKLAKCATAGADVSLNYSTGNFKTLLKENGLYGDIDIVFDPVGGDLSEVCMRALGFGGRFIVIGFASGGATPKNAIPRLPLNLALLNERQILGCFWGSWKMQDGGVANRANMLEMMHLVKVGKLIPLIEKVHKIEEFMPAMDQLMQRMAIGKVVVKV